MDSMRWPGSSPELALLRFLGYLTDIAGTRTKEVAVMGKSRVRDLLPEGFPETNVLVLVNGTPGTLETIIENHSSVTFLPMISGG